MVNIILPVKSFAEAKTRLSEVLSPKQRAGLGRLFFDHVLAITNSLADVARCFVVSSSSEALDMASGAGARVIAEAGSGLNAALRQAVLEAGSGNATLMLSTDLPLLTRGDVMAMIAGDEDVIRIAADHTGTGTNALFVPSGHRINPMFGPGSLAAHQNSARTSGARWEVVRRQGLATDIDNPADLLALTGNPRVQEPVRGFLAAINQTRV